MKRLIFLLFLFPVINLHAQKNIDGLIDAEKSFAAYSVQHGTKEAFLKFLDSNGIVFEEGKAINGKKAWTKRNPSPSVLNWQPQFAEIALSNDFGYTTGPWRLSASRNSDTVIARGQYTTIWHTGASGEWKFLVDLGVNNALQNQNATLTKIEAKKTKGSAETNDVLQAEQDFVEAFKKDKTKAYNTYLSGNSILNRNGFSPATDQYLQSESIKNTPPDINFSITGSGISSSRDLAYVYGNAVINNNRENYLRIWRREKNGWKIALEVLRY